MWGKNRDGVLAAIRGEDKSAAFRNKCTRHPFEAVQRFNVSVVGAVDDIQRIVAGVRDVETIGCRMNVSMVETGSAAVLGQLDITDVFHTYDLFVALRLAPCRNTLQIGVDSAFR